MAPSGRSAGHVDVEERCERLVDLVAVALAAWRGQRHAAGRLLGLDELLAVPRHQAIQTAGGSSAGRRRVDGLAREALVVREFVHDVGVMPPTTVSMSRSSQARQVRENGIGGGGRHRARDCIGRVPRPSSIG